MEQFEIAFGQCTVHEDVLRIDRSDPEELGRWGVFREEVRTAAEYRPMVTTAWLGVMSGLGLIFVGLLVSLYTSNPSVAPLVGGLGLFGVLVVGGALEVRYRRELRERRDLQATLADEFSIERPSRIPLDTICSVTVRPVSTRRLIGDGYFFLVHFRRDDEKATTPLGVPEFMDDQIDTARTLFEQHDIPVAEE